MSTRNVDERIVEMQFDNKQFESGIDTSLKSLDKLKQGLDLGNSAKSLNDLAAAGKRFSLGGVADAVQNIADRFTAWGVLGLRVLTQLSDAAINLGKNLVNTFAIQPVTDGFGEYELKMGSIQTIMAGTGASLDEVNQKLNELNVYADKTIYSFKDMTSNIGKFTNAGVSLDKSVAAIQGIANAAALSGANTAEASRAMYNLAQALSSGYVALRDWMSIENANMATVEFKTQLMEAAVAQGTLTKTSDGLYKTLKGNVISATTGFRDSLQEQWMTSEALVKTLNDYADETTDIGRRATAAATEVKTFTQLFDTLKEAAGSGWAQTWEILVGDFEEAKELLTGINNIVGGFIDKMSDARNTLLSGAMSSGWKQFLNTGIVNANDFMETVTGVAKEYEIDIEAMIKETGSFANSLKEGWMTGDILQTTMQQLASKFEGLTDAEIEALGYTRQNVTAIQAMVAAAEEGTFSMEELADAMTAASGREMLISGLANVAKVLGDALKPIGEAFRQIFPAKTSEDLYAMIEGFKKFTETLKIGEETADKIRRSFAGVFAVLDLVKQGFNFLWNVAKLLFPTLGTGASTILDLTAKLGDFLVSLRDSANEGQVFITAFERIRDIFNAVSEKIKEAVVRIKEAFSGFKSIDMKPIGEIGDKAEKGFAPFERIGKIIGGIFEAIVKVIEWAAPIIVKLGSIVGKALGKLADIVSNAVENMEFSEILDLINQGLFAALLAGLAKFTNGLGDIGSVVGKFSGILGEVESALNAFTANIKAKTLLMIAGAIGILAVSLVAIALIPSDKLTGALAAITILFVELSAAMKVLYKAMPPTKTAGVISSMLGMSAAILILSFAMVKLAALDWGGIARGTVGIAALAAVMVASAKLLSSNNKRLMKGATGLIAFAAAAYVMSMAVERLATLNWNELAKGLTGLTVIMAEVLLFTRLMGDTKRMVSVGVGMIALGAAMLIFAEAVKRMGSMQWDEIARGLTVFSASLTAITLAMNFLPENMVGKAAGLVVVGAALLIIANAVKNFGMMKWDDIARGLTALAGSLAAITIAMNFMPKNMIGKAVGLIGVAAALQLMIEPIERMGKMSWDSVAKALITLGGAMIIFAVSLNAMKTAIPGAAALLVASAALAIFVPVLKTLGSMSLAEIGTGLLALAGAFTVIGLAALILQPLVPTILGLSAAIALLGVGVTLVGVGVLAFSTGLAALAVSATATAGAIVVIGSAIASLIPIIIEKVWEGIEAFARGAINGYPLIKDAFITLLSAAIEAIVVSIPMIVAGIFDLVNGILDALDTRLPELVQKLFSVIIGFLDELSKQLPELIRAGAAVIGAFLTGIFEALDIAKPEMLKGLAECFAVLIAAFAILAAAKHFAKDALIAAGILALVMGIMAAMFFVISLLKLDSVLSVSLGISAVLLSISAAMIVLSLIPIPAALSAVAGLAIFIGGLTAILIALGGIAQIPGVDWLISEGTEVLLAIGSALGGFVGNIVGGVLGGITSALPQMGSDLSQFMLNAMPFILGAKLIDSKVMVGVLSLAAAMLVLTGASILDGLTSWLTGGSSFVSFGEEIAAFAPYLATFYGYIKDVQPDIIEGSANAALALANMASNLPNSGGLLGKITGENSIVAFAEELVIFGPKLMQYADSVKGLDADVVVNSTNAASALSEMASNLPNSGGWAGAIMGDNSLAAFASELALFGPAFAEYAKSVEGINPDVVTASANAAAALSSMAQGIPNSGGWVALFTGDNGLGAFGKELAKFGEHFYDYYTEIQDIDSKKLNVVVSSITALVDLAKSLASGTTDGFSNFAKALSEMGEVAIDELIKTFEGSDAKVRVAVKKVISYIATGFSNGKSQLMASTNNIISAMLDSFKASRVKWIELGEYLMDGIRLGIDNRKSKVIQTAVDMAKQLIREVRSELGIHSPSKVFAQIGEYVSLGEAEGVENKADVVEDTAVEVLAVAPVEAVRKKDPAAEMVIIGEGTAEAFALGVRNAQGAVEIGGAYLGKSLVDNVKEPLSVGRDELGGYFVKGIAEGIKKDTSAEEAAKLVGQNIVSAFKTEFDKLSLYETSADLNYELWEKTAGVDASEAEKSAAQMSMLSNKIEYQADRLDLAQGEYRQTIEVFGQSSLEAQEAYNKFLKEQINLAELINQMNDMQQTAADAQKNAYDKYIQYIIENGEVLAKAGFSDEKINEAAISHSGYDPTALEKNMTKTISDSTEMAMTAVETTFENQADETFGGLTPQFGNYGATYAGALGSGFEQASPSMVGSMKNSVIKCLMAIEPYVVKIKEAGAFFGQGFADGILSKLPEIAAAGAKAGEVALAAIQAATRMGSPSKETIEYGMYLDEGLAIGLVKYSYLSSDAAEEVGEATLLSLRTIMSKLSDVVSSDMDLLPTITPVLDLTDVKMGAAELNTLLSRQNALNVSMSRGRAASAMNAHDITSKSSENNSDTATGNFVFNQYNNSPKALSRIEIYRQTKNQLSAAKGLVKAR